MGLPHCLGDLKRGPDIENHPNKDLYEIEDSLLQRQGAKKFKLSKIELIYKAQMFKDPRSLSKKRPDGVCLDETTSYVRFRTRECLETRNLFFQLAPEYDLKPKTPGLRIYFLPPRKAVVEIQRPSQTRVYTEILCRDYIRTVR